MKKVIALATMACLPLMYASAEGYQINTQSTKQAGMGHTGVALKLGAESMHFNPAGMAFMKNSIDMSAGVIGVFASTKLTNGYTTIGGNTTTVPTSKNNVSPSTPIYAYAGFKVYDNLAVGFSVTTPYGSSIEWNKDWAGAHLIQNISLKAFNLQPTVSWRITNRLSVGAGLMMNFGNIELNKALIGPGELKQALLAKGLPTEQVNSLVGEFDDRSAVSVNLNGKAGLRFGYNIGAMYDINDKWTLGASYRSKVKVKVNDGDVALSFANEAVIKQLIGSSLPNFDNASFTAELPLPSNFNIGVSFKPNNRWVVTGEVNFVGWAAYDKLQVNFLPSSELSGYDIDAAKCYKNTRIYRAGTQFQATNRLKVRFGAYVDESPVKTDYLNPETPSMTKLGLAAGLSFTPVQKLSVDFAFTYVTGFGRDGSYTDKSMLLKVDRTFGGHYDVTALMPAIGLSYAF